MEQAGELDHRVTYEELVGHHLRRGGGSPALSEEAA